MLQAVALLAASKPSLTSLNLRENEFGDRGAIVLSKGFERAPALATVDLCGNQVSGQMRATWQCLPSFYVVGWLCSGCVVLP